MNKRKLSIAVLVVLFLVFLVVFLIFINRPNHGKAVEQNAFVSDFLASNINYPELTSDGNIRFFTGSAVAKLDTNTYKTTSVTKEFSLPETLDLKWNNSMALIKFGRIEDFHELVYSDVAIKQQAFSWWLFDVNDQTFKQVVSDHGQVVDADWYGDDRIVVVAQNNTPKKQQLVFMTADHSSIVGGDFSVSNTKLIGNTSAGILAFDGSSLMTYTPSSKTLLGLSAAREPLILSDKSGFVYEEVVDDVDTLGKQVEVKKGSLLHYDLENSKKTLLFDDNSGNYALANNSVFLFPTDITISSNVKTDRVFPEIVNLLGGSRTSLILNEEALRYTSTLGFVLGYEHSVDSFHAFIVNQRSRIVLLSNDESVLSLKPSSPVVPFSSGIISFKSGTMSYNVATNIAEIDLKNGARRSSILDEIRSEGIDPNQIHKVWLENTEIQNN